MVDNRDVVISVPVIEVNLSSFGFHYYAADFLEAGRLFLESRIKSKGYSPVLYFLYSKAIELSLKAFLLAEKIPKKELGVRGINHDLEKALAQAKLMKIENLISFSTDDEEAIKKANSYYKLKGFEYCEKAEMIVRIMGGYPDLPDLNVLEKLATKLVVGLREHCLNA